MRIWKKTFKSVLTDEKLREAVCALFADQKRFIAGSKLGARGKLWFEVDEQHSFSPGLARLLEEVDRLGCLSKAVDSIRISYEHAWNLIREAESNLGKKLLIPKAGNAEGGLCELSDDGRKLLEIYRRVNAEVGGRPEANPAEEYDPELDGI